MRHRRLWRHGNRKGRPFVFETLEPTHPRLMLKDADLARLKRLIADHPDSLPAQYYPLLIEEADALLAEEPLRGGPVGSRRNQLPTSRAMVKRMQIWGLAWRLSGDARYADRAREEMLRVAAFETWDTKVFLATGEMTHAMGLGYDWFHSHLDDEARQAIRRSILEKGLQPGIRRQSDRPWWLKDDNWNPVCNFGLIVGALAVADTDPEPARRFIESALESLPKALVMYGPDGAWAEGPGYWHYATRYTVYGLSALESALGTDLGLGDFDGMDKTGLYRIHSAGPTERCLTYADVGMARRTTSPMLFYLSRRYSDPLLAQWEYAQIDKHGAEHTHLLWHVDRPQGEMPDLDLDRQFRGPVPIAVFRSAWHDPDALFVGVKGGYNLVPHGHLDLGNFELDALGVRWAFDLGSDDYNLPEYFSMGVGARRWTYYRMHNHSHNVPTIDNATQWPLASASITRFESTSISGLAIVNLTEAYAPQARRAMRGVAMAAYRRYVVVRDEIDLRRPAEIAWGFCTTADIDLSDPREARLTQDGKAIRVRLLSPEGAAFAEESARQEPPEKTNEGVRRLMIRYGAPEGETTVTVQFVPEWPDGGEISRPRPVALSKWTHLGRLAHV